MNYKYTDSSRKIDINDQNAYKVSLSWEYDNDDSGYPTSAEITLVHEKEKLLSNSYEKTIDEQNNNNSNNEEKKYLNYYNE
jgi:hypothetical protein